MINSIGHMNFIQQSQKYSLDKHNQVVVFDNNAEMKSSDSNVSRKPLNMTNSIKIKCVRFYIKTNDKGC